MKILSNLFKDMTVSTKTGASQKIQIKEEGQSQEVSPIKMTKEEDAIKAVFDAENKEMTQEDLQTVKTFIEEAPGSLSEKLEALKLVLQKDIPLTGKHLKQVHLAINFPLPDLVIEHAEGKEPHEELEQNDSYEKKIFKAVKRNLFQISDKTSQEVDQDSQALKDDRELEGPPPRVGVERELAANQDQPLEDDQALVLDDMAEDFLAPLEQISQALDQALSETKRPVLKMVEVKVTEEMTRAKIDFQQAQKFTVNKLDQLSPRNLPVDGKEVLLAVIDKLDDLLMKSDMTLYTDIKTERDLLASSSLLDKARVMIKDQPEKAFEIIKQVKGQIEKIKFNPSKERMFGLVQDKFDQEVRDQQALQYSLQLKEDMGVSPRRVLETLRGMGLNHEAEVSEILNKQDKTSFKSIENMKSVLMKLEGATEERVVKTLDHITGQQLVNKLDAKGQKQHLVFHLPVETQTEIKDMKIHVNGQKNNQKMDWQNSRLYFVVHLDSIGDTGILVEVHGGQLSMTIKNDSDHLEDKMTTIMAEAQDRLSTVGFKPSTIKFDRLSPKQEVKEDKAKVDKEGFDVTI